MSVNVPVRDGFVVNTLQKLVGTVSGHIQTIPKLVKMIIEEDMWRSFTSKVGGATVTNKTFEEWVKRPFPYGLDTDIITLRQICQHHPDVLSLIDKATAT